MTFQLNDDDVVSMNAQHSFGVGNIFKFGSLKQQLKDRLGSRWVDDSIECEVLSTSGGGWQKAKIRLCLDVVLDEPTPEESDAVRSPNQ